MAGRHSHFTGNGLQARQLALEMVRGTATVTAIGGEALFTYVETQPLKHDILNDTFNPITNPADHARMCRPEKGQGACNERRVSGEAQPTVTDIKGLEGRHRRYHWNSWGGTSTVLFIYQGALNASPSNTFTLSSSAI